VIAIYITGDTHGDFSGIYDFCNAQAPASQHDTLIILGDAGLNYYGDSRDMVLKMIVSRLPLTLFCIHGNHEMRPNGIASYTEIIWRGGVVYMEEAFPNILFAKDGEIFDLDGTKAITIGGAYSVDKYYRIAYGYRWFEDEQPSEEIREQVEHKLDSVDWKIDNVLSHTCPLKYEPTEVFIQGIDQATVDKSTERWLDSIESKLTYNRWLCGHYHTEKQIDRLQFLYHSLQKF
jgi:3-oxoacid CoA-transferase subunit A